MPIHLAIKLKAWTFNLRWRKQQVNNKLVCRRTHEKHFDIRSSTNNGTAYRIPDQPDTGDGNTVDVQMERNLYLDNSMHYQASLQFMNSKIKGLKKALAGGKA